MNDLILSAKDVRQARGWGNYLKSLGWKIENLENIQIFIRPLIFFSSIKIQHAVAPMPFAKIDSLAKKNKALCVIIEPHIKNYNPADYKQSGYEESRLRLAHSKTIKIDLARSLEDIFQSFSENARRNINKAEKNNLRIEIRHDESFADFYRLLKNLSKQKRFGIPSEAELKNKMSALHDGSFVIFAYDAGKEPIAAVWFYHFDNVVAYIQTGINDTGYKMLANYLLVWEGMKIAKNLGVEIFDFEGIFDERYPKDHPAWENFSEFKKRFHGEIVEYPPSWIKIYNPIFKFFYRCFPFLFF